ncbi:MAG: hypothetical protein KDA24_16755 [Deltaproteobacteria bacterium]|nr:hypothetical protein [Deltaproteobacteria bacterium]
MYVSLFSRLVRLAASGALTVRSGREHRRIFFVAGSPVWFESNRTADQLDESALEDPDARLAFVKRGIAGPMQWESGGWTFEPSDGLPAELLLRAVFLDCSPLAPLWIGVKDCVRQDEVLGPMTDRTAGPVMPTDGLASVLPELELDGPLAELATYIPGPTEVTELLRRFAHQHREFFRLLWMLEAMGAIERDGPRDVALGMVPPHEDPFGGGSLDYSLNTSDDLAAVDIDDDPEESVPAHSGADVEPDTREVDVTHLHSASLPSEQVLDAIRKGTRASPDQLLGEWSSGPVIPPLTRTVPSGTPSDVLPDLPSYRPSARAADTTGRYRRSNLDSPAPTRPPEPARSFPSGSVPRSTPSRPTSATGSLPSSRPPSATGSVPSGSLSSPGSRRRTNPTARRVPSLKGSRLSDSGASVPAAISDAGVRKDYRTRMGTDFYTFLGVPQKANQSVIDRAWTKLLKRWTSASKNKGLPDEVRQMARELAQVTHLAGRTFSVPARRQEYDRRLGRGQAPLAGGVRAARTHDLPGTNPGASAPVGPAMGALVQARGMIEARDFGRAVSVLRALRVKNPSDPEVLASLGWAVWKASAETEREQAEEFLQLATTFNPSHVQAREYLARIALDMADHGTARQRLERLLKVKPDATWARAALGRLPGQDEGGGRRLAFWKK